MNTISNMPGLLRPKNWEVGQFDEVGTPRCGVTGRVQRAELLQTTMIKGSRCAAERGADSAARCPYPNWRIAKNCP